MELEDVVVICGWCWMLLTLARCYFGFLKIFSEVLLVSHTSVDPEGLFIIAASLFYTNQSHNMQLLPKFKKCPVIGDWVLLK